MALHKLSNQRWRKATFWVALSIPATILLYVGMLIATLPAKSGIEVGFSDFSRQIQEGTVSSAVLLNFDSIVLFRSEGVEYRAVLPDNDITVDRVLQAAQSTNVTLDVDQQRIKGLIQPLLGIIPAFAFMATILLIFLLQRSSNGAIKAAARKGAADKDVTFADVAGADDAVAEVREVRDFLREPERFRAMGAEPPRGILLVGPPGTGKTLLARAVAGEAGVPFFSIAGTEFAEMYVGVGAARVRDLFRKVRESAPAILFIDEIDATGRARGSASLGSEERETTLNQLLVEMDGFDRFSGVVLMGATNRPDVLDPALLRRGRFDRQVVVGRPDRVGRRAILEVHARGKRLDASVSLEQLAAQTPGFTGADLASVLNEAALLAGRRGISAIGPTEVEEAIDRVIAGNEHTTRRLSPEEKRAVAFHEGGHAIAAWALPGTDPVTKISIVSRGQALGLTWMTPEEERFLTTRSELVGRMAVAMGGMAAEEIVLGETTSGPRTDLRRATEIARMMVCELGMSEALGKVTLGREVGTGGYLGGELFQADYSPEVASLIDKEIRRVTDEAYELVRQILELNRQLLDRLADALVDHETLREPELTGFAEMVKRPGDTTSRRPAGGRLAILAPARSARE